MSTGNGILIGVAGILGVAYILGSGNSRPSAVASAETFAARELTVTRLANTGGDNVCDIVGSVQNTGSTTIEHGIIGAQFLTGGALKGQSEELLPIAALQPGGTTPFEVEYKCREGGKNYELTARTAGITTAQPIRVIVAASAYQRHGAHRSGASPQTEPGNIGG